MTQPVRHFLDLWRHDGATLRAILDDAHARKAARKGWTQGRVDPDAPAKDRTLAMIFEKNSTRTRFSFDAAMRQLGGDVIISTASDMQLGRGETIEDTARVLSRMVDAIMLRANRHQDVERLAYAATVPVLELDDGTCLSETVAICRYFDELQPNPPLFGTTPLEMAHVDQWVRRSEFIMMTPVGMFWRHAHPYTAALLTQFKEFGESNRETVMGAMRWFDRELDGKAFLAGAAYTMADICLLTTVDFGHWIGLEMPSDVPHLKAWHERVSARPSASA